MHERQQPTRLTTLAIAFLAFAAASALALAGMPLLAGLAGLAGIGIGGLAFGSARQHAPQINDAIPEPPQTDDSAAGKEPKQNHEQPLARSVYPENKRKHDRPSRG